MGQTNIDATGGSSLLGNFFKKKLTTAVGVDIGTSSIKIVQLERKHEKFYLKNYALVKVNAELTKGLSTGVISPETGEIVLNALQQAGIKTDHINTAVPSFSSLITSLELPMMPESEIDSIVSVEAPKYIPVPLNDVVYGWQMIPSKTPQTNGNNTASGEQPKPPSQPKQLRLLLVAVMKEVSSKYEEVFNASGLKIEFLEVDSFSLKRSLVGDEEGNYLIVDIGEKVATIIMVADSSVVLNRTLDVAGNKIKEVIARGMNVSLEKAEDMKIKHGLDSDKKFGVKLLEPTVNTMVSELRRAMEIFQRDYPGQTINRILLSGGTAKLKGLSQFFEQELSTPVSFGNPWHDVVYPSKLESTLQIRGHLFSVAVGLAMLGLED